MHCLSKLLNNRWIHGSLWILFSICFATAAFVSLHQMILVVLFGAMSACAILVASLVFFSPESLASHDYPLEGAVAMVRLQDFLELLAEVIGYEDESGQLPRIWQQVQDENSDED